jgi:hypothetical protein
MSNPHGHYRHLTRPGVTYDLRTGVRTTHYGATKRTVWERIVGWARRRWAW